MKNKKHKTRLDFPFDEVAETAMDLMEQGITIFQKFTCAGCGQRLTIDVPNKFFIEGTCDKCKTVTNIKKQGCNYTAMSGVPGDVLATVLTKIKAH